MTDNNLVASLLVLCRHVAAFYLGTLLHCSSSTFFPNSVVDCHYHLVIEPERSYISRFRHRGKHTCFLSVCFLAFCCYITTFKSCLVILPAYLPLKNEPHHRHQNHLFLLSPITKSNRTRPHIIPPKASSSFPLLHLKKVYLSACFCWVLSSNIPSFLSSVVWVSSRQTNKQEPETVFSVG